MATLITDRSYELDSEVIFGTVGDFLASVTVIEHSDLLTLKVDGVVLNRHDMIPGDARVLEVVSDV